MIMESYEEHRIVDFLLAQLAPRADVEMEMQHARVRVLQCSGKWCEVQVVEHAAPRADENGADQGWLDATKLR